MASSGFVRDRDHSSQRRQEGQEVVELEERLDQLRGQTVDLRLEISRHLSDAELVAFGDDMVAKGMVVDFVQMRSRPWPHTLRLVFDNPEGVGLFWIPAIAILGSLGGLGIVGYTAYKANQFMDSITRNIVPLTMVAAGITLVIAWAFRR